MTKSNRTLRAFICSILSMMVCLAMLVGSTFAWFSDSVVSGTNKIVAGNLDVELQYSILNEDGSFKEWKDVKSDTSVFKDGAKWEPGHTEYVYLKIKNAGNLALQYQLSLNVYADASGAAEKSYTSMLTNEDGTNKKFKLSDHLVFTQEDGQKSITKREDLWIKNAEEEKAALGKLDGLGKTNQKLLSGDEEIITVAVYMPTSVGNEANQLTSAKATEGEPTIFLGLDLQATQTPYENDSFGEHYDDGAKLPWNGTEKDTTWYDALNPATEYTLSTPAQLAGLAEMVNTGTTFENVNITLSDDVDLVNQEWTPIGEKGSGKYFKGTFDGNGKTIKGLKINSANVNQEDTFDGYAALFGATQDAEIKNVTVIGEVDAKNAAGVVARANKNTTITNCVSNVTVNGSGKAGGIVCLTNSKDGPVTITGCTNNGTVTGGNSGLGGIVGYANPNTSISDCTNTATVGASNARFAGGIVGYGSQNNSTIINSTNSGNIISSGSTGGIIGIATGAWTVTGCNNSGTISGDDHAISGGIIGSMQSGKVENCNNSASIHGQYAGGVVGCLGGAPEVVNCSGGSAAITTPAFTLGFTGQSFTMDLPENATAGRLIGTNQGGGPDAYSKLTIDDANADDYTNINTIGICGNTTTWSNLELVSGTLHGDPVAGNGTYIKLNEGATWSDREAGTYTAGGVVEASRKENWTKM